jgi:hypothetical protein
MTFSDNNEFDKESKESQFELSNLRYFSGEDENDNKSRRATFWLKNIGEDIKVRNITTHGDLVKKPRYTMCRSPFTWESQVSYFYIIPLDEPLQSGDKVIVKFQTMSKGRGETQTIECEVP